MTEQTDWFVRSRELGVPSGLAHDTYEKDGIPGLRALCEGWRKDAVVRVEIDEQAIADRVTAAMLGEPHPGDRLIGPSPRPTEEESDDAVHS